MCKYILEIFFLLLTNSAAMFWYFIIINQNFIQILFYLFFVKIYIYINIFSLSFGSSFIFKLRNFVKNLLYIDTKVMPPIQRSKVIVYLPIPTFPYHTFLVYPMNAIEFLYNRKNRLRDLCRSRFTGNQGMEGCSTHSPCYRPYQD